MSQIVGSTSILIASEYLSNVHNGIGKMLGGITGINPTEIVIIGAGIAGEYAAKTAIGLGALVKIFDKSFLKLERLQNNIKHPIFTSVLQPKILNNALKTADVVIGAINPSISNRKFFVSEDMVKNMKRGSVIIDISIDQGGCFETSKLTDLKNPVYIKHGVVHYCVPNISSRVGRTASYALSNIITPILLSIAEAGGINNLLRKESGIRNGTYIYRGMLTNYEIGDKFDIPAKDFDLIMAAL
jgi:alanine dehydrogenase